MVTLKDIAQKTGFSLSVVSRAMNPRPDQKVAEKTRAIIAAACRELNYHPNQAASLLARGSSASIGLFLPRAYGEMVGQMMTGMADVANHHGFAYNVYFGINDDDYREFIRYSHHTQCAGIISYMPSWKGTRTQEMLQQLSEQNCRIVMLNCEPLNLPGLQTVCIDNAYGGRTAAQHLQERGCRRFLLPSSNPEPSWQLVERMRGFTEYLTARGIATEQPCIQRNAGYQLADAKFESLILELADGGDTVGIFMSTDYEALALYSILTRHHRLECVGKNLKIIGFDDIIASWLVHPKLTTLEQPFLALGEISMTLLLNALVKANLPVDMERLKPALVVRESA